MCSSPTATVLLSDTFHRLLSDDFTNEAGTNNAAMQWSALDPPDPLDAAGPTFTLFPSDGGFKGLQIVVPAAATATQFLNKVATGSYRAYCVTLHGQISAATAGMTSRMELLGLRLTGNGPTRLISLGVQGASPELALRTSLVTMPGSGVAHTAALNAPDDIHDFYLVVDLDRQMGALYIDPPDGSVPNPTLEVPYDGGDASGYVLELGAAPNGGGGIGVGATTVTAEGLRFSAQ